MGVVWMCALEDCVVWMCAVGMGVVWMGVVWVCALMDVCSYGCVLCAFVDVFCVGLCCVNMRSIRFLVDFVV